MSKRIDDNTLLALALTGMTQTAIAKELGVTKTAICRRMKTDAFQELLSTYRKKVLDGVLTDLTANAQKSVQTLVELLDSENDFIRLHAAVKVLSMSQEYSIQKDLLSDVDEWKQARRLEQI